VRAYIDGDESAFEILLLRHKSGLYAKILSMVRDRELAEDFFQETFFRAITFIKSGRYNENGKFRQWLFRIARNMILDHFRKASHIYMCRSDEEHGDIFEWMDLEARTKHDDMITEEIRKDLRQALKFLPEDQRIIVFLRVNCRMGFKEIAEELGISLNTALGRMRYAVLKIRKHMKTVQEKNSERLMQ
jgi:RNA polymerase sigma factor (sigma-70 family)